MVSMLFVATAVLSLSMSRFLWQASWQELAHSDLVNAERAAWRQFHFLLQQQGIPARCWHHSKAPWLSEAHFTAHPHDGCSLETSEAQHFYWLEDIGVATHSGKVLRAYHVLLLTELSGRRWQEESFGFTSSE